MIQHRNLALLSNRLFQENGGKRIPEATLDRDYVLSWFLTGLSQSPLAEKLAFKGGTALKKIHFPGYRFSEDLDFTLVEALPWEEIRQAVNSINLQVSHESGITLAFDRLDDAHRNSNTFYLSSIGPVGRTQTTKVDITRTEQICFPLEKLGLCREYAEYSDLPEDVKILSYSMEEIASEKILALCDISRNEPRDLYDIWYMVQNVDIRWPELADAIVSKMEFREKDTGSMEKGLIPKEKRYHKIWEARMGHQVAVLPEFETVWREVQRSLRKENLFAEINQIATRRPQMLS